MSLQHARTNLQQQAATQAPDRARGFPVVQLFLVIVAANIASSVLMAAGVAWLADQQNRQTYQPVSTFTSVTDGL